MGPIDEDDWVEVKWDHDPDDSNKYRMGADRKYDLAIVDDGPEKLQLEKILQERKAAPKSESSDDEDDEGKDDDDALSKTSDDASNILEGT